MLSYTADDQVDKEALRKRDEWVFSERRMMHAYRQGDGDLVRG